MSRFLTSMAFGNGLAACNTYTLDHEPDLLRVRAGGIAVMGAAVA